MLPSCSIWELQHLPEQLQQCRYKSLDRHQLLPSIHDPLPCGGDAGAPAVDTAGVPLVGLMGGLCGPQDCCGRVGEWEVWAGVRDGVQQTHSMNNNVENVNNNNNNNNNNIMTYQVHQAGQGTPAV